ncbi:MAG TPA: hypothetical protein VFQ77_10180 [Pseudonocardiaceae bacterium]|nr:hypothetical protein [Pseudonocardiaceae bacterium]
MARSPNEALRRFELEMVMDAPADRRVRELHILGRLNALEVVVAHRIAEVVQVCREQGASWAEIGAMLHISKQAAHERFGHRRRASSPRAQGTA